ncbi:MAG: hypothetical protein EPN17_06130 [Methylobacter sp.]|nr:MAG: hypothetical protein EPN17_06130 [Methylobacter sp.]
MSINLQLINNQDQYDLMLFLTLAQLEGRGKSGKPGEFYIDSAGHPTIGIGFSLELLGVDSFDPRPASLLCVIALLWLLGLTTLALCSFNAHADDIKSIHKIEFNKTPPKAILSELLQSSHYANESPPNMAYYEEFDLNNDNSNEYFLYINDSGWCGSGNCPMFIFEKKRGIIRPLLEVSSGPIVYILNHKINGYYDISFFPDGEVNRNIFHWNGKQYK